MASGSSHLRRCTMLLFCDWDYKIITTFITVYYARTWLYTSLFLFILLPTSEHNRMFPVTTCPFQYVELRYKSRKLRLLATLCNLLNKFFYMGICLYAPSLALSTVTKLSTWTSMVIMGSICTFYITVVSVQLSHSVFWNKDWLD